MWIVTHAEHENRFVDARVAVCVAHRTRFWWHGSEPEPAVRSQRGGTSLGPPRPVASPSRKPRQQ